MLVSSVLCRPVRLSYSCCGCLVFWMRQSVCSWNNVFELPRNVRNIVFSRVVCCRDVLRKMKAILQKVVIDFVENCFLYLTIVS